MLLLQPTAQPPGTARMGGAQGSMTGLQLLPCIPVGPAVSDLPSSAVRRRRLYQSACLVHMLLAIRPVRAVKGDLPSLCELLFTFGG
jgi:hypothetical protein